MRHVNTKKKYIYKYQGARVTQHIPSVANIKSLSSIRIWFYNNKYILTNFAKDLPVFRRIKHTFDTRKLIDISGARYTR